MPTVFAVGRRLGFDLRVRPVRRLRHDLRDTQTDRVIAQGREIDAFRLAILQRFPDGWRERGAHARQSGVSRESIYTAWLAERLAGGRDPGGVPALLVQSQPRGARRRPWAGGPRRHSARRPCCRRTGGVRSATYEKALAGTGLTATACSSCVRLVGAHQQKRMEYCNEPNCHHLPHLPEFCIRKRQQHSWRIPSGVRNL